MDTNILIWLAIVVMWFRIVRPQNKKTGIIMVSALEHFFVDFPTGKVRDKCCRLGPRSIFLGLLYQIRTGVKPVIILYEEPEAGHLEYLRDIFGDLMPRVLWPRHVPDGPLDLVGAVLGDETLMNTLRGFEGYKIEGLLNHPRLSDLENQLGMKTTYESKTVRWLTVNVFNSKVWFQRLTCPWRKEPNSIRCVGTEQIRRRAQHFLVSGGRVMLRLDRAAGGLGNKLICNMSELKDFLSEVEKDDSLCIWRREPTLVEPVLDVTRDLSVMIRVGKFGPRVLGFVARVIEEKTTSAGSTFPAPNLAKKDENYMRRCALAYGWVIWLMSFRGEADLDASLLSSGRFAWFESNGRWLATSVQYAVFVALKDSNGVVHGNDCLKIGPKVSTLDFKSFLEENGWLWSKGDAVGVIVTVPAYDGALSYVALAPDHKQLFELQSAIMSWAKTTCPT